MMRSHKARKARSGGVRSQNNVKQAKKKKIEMIQISNGITQVIFLPKNVRKIKNKRGKNAAFLFFLQQENLLELLEFECEFF